MEHHSALIRVVEAEEYGTAAALLRPLLEASTTGYWFVYVASCDEIARLPTTPIDNPETDLPLLNVMLASLVDIFPPIQTIIDGLKRGGAAKWLHKYTHGTAPQLARRVPEGWTEREVHLTLIRGDMFSDLAAIVETVIAPNPKLSKYAFSYRDELGAELQANFPTDEPIEQQPHSLPPAPLLNEGCGPPFG